MLIHIIEAFYSTVIVRGYLYNLCSVMCIMFISFYCLIFCV